jgi:hypothetical protein
MPVPVTDVQTEDVSVALRTLGVCEGRIESGTDEGSVKERLDMDDAALLWL